LKPGARNVTRLDRLGQKNMRPVRRHNGVLIAVALGLAMPSITRAVEATPVDAAALEEVVVTAERRTERPLDVPASMTVISAADIEKVHATSLVDLTAAAPGFVIVSGGSPGQTTIVLRGLPPLGGTPMVSTLIDDISVGSSTAWAAETIFALDMLPYDIERIEILRGPQGTLYGADSMGGVLKYVTKDPNLTASEAQIGANFFDIRGGGSMGAGVRASWSAPLIDGALALRGSLYAEETPGYIKNPLRGLNHENSLSQYGGRLAMLWQPQSELQVRLQGIYQRTDSDGDAVTFAQLLGTAQDPYYQPGAWLGGYLTYPHVIPEPFSSDLKFLSATINWHTTFFDFVSVTGYSDKQAAQTQDWSQTYGYLQPTFDPNTTSMLNRMRFYARVKRASQEVRLVSPSGQRLEWLAGVYYDSERASSEQYFDALDSELNLIPSLNPFSAAYSPSTYTEAAIFGTLTYRISDRFDVTGGLRWLTNRQYVEIYAPPNFLGPAIDTVMQSTEQPATYAFSARYRPRPETMAYVRIASGYRPGTQNQFVPGYTEIPPLTQADTMVDYEIGIKSELMNRKASLELAVYRINWSDMQLDVTTPDGAHSYAINAGNAISEGFEFSATYWPIDAFHLAIDAAYTDAYAAEAVPAAEILPGARLGSSPKWTAGATFDCQLGRFDQWTSYLNGSWRYIAAQYSELSTQSPVGLTPGYSWADVNFGVENGRYDVRLFAKNLFDKQAFNNGNPYSASTAGPGAPVPPGPPSPSYAGTPIQPRLVGISVTLTLRP
jgi:outer membrane receptor protein involved in Fe transport